MEHCRKDNRGLYPRLDMTPMIDVVFQLLIFFVVAVKQDDILSKLSAARPGSGGAPGIELIDITVSAQGFFFNGRVMNQAELERRLEQYSRLSKSATVTIRCTADSPHALLVQSLDICSKHGMTNLSVFSM